MQPDSPMEVLLGLFSKFVKTGPSLFLAAIALMTGLHSNGAGAEQQPEPVAEKESTESNAAADILNIKVATVFGRDIFRKDLEPPAKWLEDREKHLKQHGETPGLVSLETYRANKLYEAIWKPLSDKYIPKQDVEPTAEELQEFIVHYHQSKERKNKEKQERLKLMRTEVDKQEKQLSSQDSEDREETSQRLQKIQSEINAMEKSFEIDRAIQGKGENFEQFFAKWWVGNWKRQRWFYKRYGGRVIYQQVGPEAIDAMRDFLKEAEFKKDFVIHDKHLNAKFWAPYTIEPPGTLVPDPDKVFEHPWSISASSTQTSKRQPPADVKMVTESVEQGDTPTRCSGY